MNRRSWLLLLGVVLSLFAQGAALAHLCLVRHGICPKHGELTELVGRATGTDGAPAEVKSRTVALSSNASDIGNIDAGDEHCVLAQLLRQVNAAHAPAIRLASNFESDVAVTPASAVARSTWVLDVAPKQSPPA